MDATRARNVAMASFVKKQEIEIQSIDQLIVASAMIGRKYVVFERPTILSTQNSLLSRGFAVGYIVVDGRTLTEVSWFYPKA